MKTMTEFTDADRRAEQERCSAVVNGIRRYHTAPQLPPCHRGDYRVWMPDGAHYQQQMFCARHRTAINPNGAACVLCAAGAWPRPGAAPSPCAPVTYTAEERAAARRRREA